MTVAINGFVIDAARSVEFNLPHEVTSFPVEKGADFTDHVRKLPVSVKIEGVVSDTPLGTVAELRANETSKPSETALAMFESIRGVPVLIETPRRTYQNMVLEDLEVPDDAKTGAALVFTATFLQVEIVENKRTTVSIPRAKKKRTTSKAPIKESLSQTRILYDENGNAYGREEVFYDPKANGGRGTYYREDGRTELTQEELQSYNDDLEDDFNKPRLNDRGQWVDGDGAPLGLNPRGGVSGSNGGAPEPSWEDIWNRGSRPSIWGGNQ